MRTGNLALAAAILAALFAAAIVPARAQAALSPEEARALEYGKEIYKIKANCQFCHKWDASGDTGYGEIALSLRKTALTPEQFAEVVKCGRPGTGMPYHDQYAYTDKRCYGVTRAELGKDAPCWANLCSRARSTPWSNISSPRRSDMGRQRTRTASTSGARIRASASR